MSETAGENYRNIAESLVQRAETDQAFAQQAKQDPVGTLTAAGIPADVAQQMLAGGAESGAEVAGYMRCADLTCWTSECPESCYISIVGPPI
jgi:hypothetical protein